MNRGAAIVAAAESFVRAHAELEALAQEIGAEAASQSALNDRVIALHGALELVILGGTATPGRCSSPAGPTIAVYRCAVPDCDGRVEKERRTTLLVAKIDALEQRVAYLESEAERWHPVIEAAVVARDKASIFKDAKESIGADERVAVWLARVKVAQSEWREAYSAEIAAIDTARGKP